MTAPQAGELAVSWQRRFAFFDLYGLPSSSPAAKAAYRTLPFWDKVRLTSNVWAFLFGFLYFYVKGMWRKGTTILGAGIGSASCCRCCRPPISCPRPPRSGSPAPS